MEFEKVFKWDKVKVEFYCNHFWFGQPALDGGDIFTGLWKNKMLRAVTVKRRNKGKNWSK